MMSGIVIFFFQGTDNLPYLVFRFDRVGFGDESAAIVFKEPFGNALNALEGIWNNVSAVFHVLKIS